MTPQEAVEPLVLIIQWLFVFITYSVFGLGIISITIHTLGAFGIGKGMPWTKTPNK